MDNSKFYVFQKSRSGETVPALCLPQGTQPLHSMVDPKREAHRLVSALGPDTGFIIFFGLGGGFLPEAALKLTDAFVIVIDFNKDAIAQLTANKDYSKLFKNNRFILLTDPSSYEIKSCILEHYKPALHGGIKTIPLRQRIEIDKPLFDCAAAAIHEVIEIITSDYSVQAHFGIRWFSNIIRNIKTIDTGEQPNSVFAEHNEAAIVAAGPSLDTQIQSLAELKKRGVFIISSDTALPVLTHNGIQPDVVVSIDCQHISYYHFLNAGININSNIPLVLDIASPPLLSGFTGFKPVFFSGGHPLVRYLSNTWRSFPVLDTSGANVTYTCLSLAEYCGIKRITIFGADFSYVGSQTYARGTYVYPYFHKRQNRLSPLEAQFSKLLYRSPFLTDSQNTTKNYYETSSLRFYRKKLEEKAAGMHAEIIIEKGFGAPVSINKGQSTEHKKENKEQKNNITGIEFLKQYRNDIAALPQFTGKENYLKKLNEKQTQVFITLLPYAAAIKKRKPELGCKELIKEVKCCCIADIERVLE